MKPVIHKEQVKTLFDSKFIKVFDLQYEEGMHYFDATRRSLDNLMAIKSTEDFQHALPDAVTCIVILENENGEARLLLTREFRYPTGQFLLSPPAGLMDEEDIAAEQPLLSTAKREIEEETGICLTEKDTLFVVNPLLFSTPGMTDESNALVCAVVRPENSSVLTQGGAVGTECFNGFELLNKEAALHLLKNGRDDQGIFYSVFTWAALMYFVTDLWK